MNKNIDLTKILKNCPKGTKFYSTVCGEVTLTTIENDTYPIGLENSTGDKFWVTKDGSFFNGLDGECILFPSKDQRDWSKFTASWYKKKKFDPKTLQPFDKVLARDSSTNWRCTFYSHTIKNRNKCKYVTDNSIFEYCIPYNEDTKHLIGTADKAPEYYRY